MGNVDSLVLGLDLGANSIGWALINTNNDEKLTKVINAGSRVFEAGMEGDISSGKAETKNAVRRAKRMIRRQLSRHKRRMKKLNNYLQKNGFFPEDKEIESLIKKLDAELTKKYISSNASDTPPINILHHTLPYYIRRRGLDHNLSNYEFGRAVYHLAQRRGFLSNRKNLNNDKVGEVKKGISELNEKMSNAKARTLGEYFCYIDPTRDRIREKWTAREMYQDEFKKICERQKHLISEEKIKELYKIIFNQRKLKPVKKFIGECSFESGEKRAQWHKIESQDFRIYQNVNNIRIYESASYSRELTTAERDKVVKALQGYGKYLDRNGYLTVPKIKTILELKKTVKLSIESETENRLKGDKTRANLIRILSDKWDSFSPEDVEEIISDLHSYEKNSALIKRLIAKWNILKEQADELASIQLEEGYCSLSLKAIRKLLTELKNGISYSTVVKNIYPEEFKCTKKAFNLPPVEECIPNLRNPVVKRCLSELRIVVNSILRDYGYPDKISIELARDVKLSQKEKEKVIRINFENQKSRESARKRMQDEFNIEHPSNDDITKILLADECQWKCPYTQRQISMDKLFGVFPQFDVEHIIPYSRSLDNSFANKTLCYHEENRSIKKNMTPYEAYSSDENKYQIILNSVEAFNGKYAEEKLRRFKMKDINEFEDFSTRQLNDTRHASKEAMQFLGLLYGGVYDENGKQRIQSVKGQITSVFRRVCGMNNILGDGEKSRDDHRHHTIDALAVAMISPGRIKELTDFMKNLDKQVLFRELKNYRDIQPLPEFTSYVRDCIRNVNTSHQVSRRVRGPLHEDTLYGISKTEKDKIKLRKNLEDLSKSEVENIADNRIRELVKSILKELGTEDPAKAFKNKENLPVLKDNNGNPVSVVKKVRLHKNLQTIPISRDKRLRHIVPGNNHHMEIYAKLNEEGVEVNWEGNVITLLEAKQRLKDNKPLYKKESTTDKKYKFSLHCGDIIELGTEKGERELCIIRAIPRSKQVCFVPINDARQQKELRTTKKWYTAYPDPLRVKKCIKYDITPLGELRRSNV